MIILNSKIENEGFDILFKAFIFMSSQITYKDNKNRIKKKLSFFEGGHQLEKLEFALK